MSREAQLSRRAQATQPWVQRLADADADGMAALYRPDAVLWGIFATRLIQGRPGIRTYFVCAFAAGLTPRAELGEHGARVQGQLALRSGLDTFTPGGQGEVRTLLACLRFTFDPQGGQWRIADHPSSRRPPAA
ncbi:MAG: nuclear transport factor 2 family protein [Curvibacter sp.]